MVLNYHTGQNIIKFQISIQNLPYVRYKNMNFEYDHDVTFPYGDIMVKQRIFKFGTQMFQLNITMVMI